MKRFVTIATISLSLAASTLIGAPVATGAVPAATSIGQISIPALGITRTIYEPAPGYEQAMIDACIGAASLRLITGVTWLGAHRTHCGDRGFGGIEKLNDGDQAIVTINGQTSTYTMFAGGLARAGSRPQPPPFGTGLVLQTSRSSSSVYLRFFQRDGGPRGPDGRGYAIDNGQDICVESGGAENEFAVVNLTPTDSVGDGYASLYPDGGDPGIIPAVYWSGPAPAPNTNIVRVGTGGRICVRVIGAASHIVIDVLGFAAPDSLRWSGQRLLDTRTQGGAIDNDKRCFSIPGTPGDWAFLNVTPISNTYGLGVVEAPDRIEAVSHVNFSPGVPNPNLTIVQIDDSGTMCFRAVGTTDVIVDLEATTASTNLAGPALRILDTRNDSRAPLGQSCFTTNFDAGPRWMFANLTTDYPVGAGYGRLHSGDQYPDVSSDINYDDSPDPNVSLVRISPGVPVCVTSMGAPAEWVVDTMAFANDGFIRPAARRRVLDTRLPPSAYGQSLTQPIEAYRKMATKSTGLFAEWVKRADAQTCRGPVPNAALTRTGCTAGPRARIRAELR